MLADMVKTAQIKADSIRAASEDSVARQQRLYDRLKAEVAAFRADIRAGERVDNRAAAFTARLVGMGYKSRGES